LRAPTTLRLVAFIASEDPRAPQALLADHGITATVTSYGPFKRQEKMLLLLHRLTQGQDVVLVSDNGTPVIYDPGSLFVAAAHQAGITVKAIPGPSAMTASAAISGFSGDAIIFDGHLPSNSHRLAQYLSRLRKERRTLVFYVGPRALTGLLKTLVQVLPTRQIAIAMILTTHGAPRSRGPRGEMHDQIGRGPNATPETVA